MSSLRPISAPSADLPSLSVRWEGLVVSVDATTLNTLVRKAVRGVEEVEEILVEPENGRLGLTIRVKKGIRFSFRGHLTSLKFKDGFLGFAIADASVFGMLPIPAWVIQKIVERVPAGRALFYPEDRVIVIDFNPLLPPDLSFEVREVVCENGELRLVFGPSQYRIDRLIADMGKDPFDGE
ncbi:MAG TPA: hypothetical protein VKF32_09175 [Thermoanaerobaculia bacterium]|nr:hypothetical protein [Thermoanaerobaculia bacterium]